MLLWTNFFLPLQILKFMEKQTKIIFMLVNIATSRDTLGLSIQNDNGHRFYGEVRYDEIDFYLISLLLKYVYSQKRKAPITASAEVKINLSKWKAPSEGVYGF